MDAFSGHGRPHANSINRVKVSMGESVGNCVLFNAVRTAMTARDVGGSVSNAE